MKVRCVGRLLSTMAAVLLLGGVPASALTVVSVRDAADPTPGRRAGWHRRGGLSERSVVIPASRRNVAGPHLRADRTRCGRQGGGRCDSSKRPTVFLAHGFGLSDPASYRDLIVHFVSIGNVVVYPSYDVGDPDGDGDTDRADLEESYRVVDAGIVAAVDVTPRASTPPASAGGATRTGAA